MANEIRVPTLGESVTEATIGQWFKKPGDAIKADEPLVELETDKVTVEVPAPASGTLGEIVANEGDTVEVGALLGTVSAGGASEAAPAKSEAASKPAKKEAPKAAASEGDGKVVDVVVPSAGESVTEAGVGEWFKGVGDFVKADEALVELETDKAAQEVPAPVSGTIVEIVAEQGANVEVGALLARIREGSQGEAAEAPAPAKAKAEQNSAGRQAGCAGFAVGCQDACGEQDVARPGRRLGQARPGAQGRCDRGAGEGRDPQKAAAPAAARGLIGR
jgi:2-oxoglutarate dehydrogenase E2 component (dihydrolipoamide succinyltransferase)